MNVFTYFLNYDYYMKIKNYKRSYLASTQKSYPRNPDINTKKEDLQLENYLGGLASKLGSGETSGLGPKAVASALAFAVLAGGAAYAVHYDNAAGDSATPQHNAVGAGNPAFDAYEKISGSAVGPDKGVKAYKGGAKKEQILRILSANDNACNKIESASDTYKKSGLEDKPWKLLGLFEMGSPDGKIEPAGWRFPWYVQDEGYKQDMDLNKDGIIDLPDEVMKWDDLQKKAPIYGVTIDSIDNLEDIIASLRGFSKRTTARIVFDPGVDPRYYSDAVEGISKQADVMGEIVDSINLEKFTPQQVSERTENYLNIVGKDISIVEVGNEVNGDWTGKPEDVRAKIYNSYNVSKKHCKETALTLHFNPCYSKAPDYEMLNWAQKYVPDEMKQNLDYIFVSFYEKNCPNANPDWKDIFHKLEKIFPNSKVGFGEIGTDGSEAEKAAMINKYYSLDLSDQKFIGGNFWWYGKQDLVPNTKPLWGVLDKAISKKPGAVAASASQASASAPQAKVITYPPLRGTGFEEAGLGGDQQDDKGYMAYDLVLRSPGPVWGVEYWQGHPHTVLQASEEKHSGKFSARIVGNPGGAVAIAVPGYGHKPPIEAGKTYELEAWVKTKGIRGDGSNGYGVRLIQQGFDPTNPANGTSLPTQIVYGDWFTGDSEGDSEWTKLTLDYTPGKGISTGDPVAEGWIESGTIYVDDIGIRRIK